MADEKKTACEGEESEVDKACDKKESAPQKTDRKKCQKKDSELEKVKSEIEKLKAELESKSDLLARTAAEFDNFKKRTEREKQGVAEYAKASLIKKLLPVVDNIDRANGADKDSPDYIKGIEMIVKQFNSLADTLEIETIGEIGDAFDPNFHEAVMHIEDENFGENEIAEVLQKGYKLGDTVIRPAMVKVAN